MARSDTDSWDLASSVGATATMVAAARALATEDADPIINDTFAAPLVRAAGIDFFTRVVDGEIDPSDAGADGTIGLQTETDSLAVRTRFFDEFFLGAAAAGIGQAVILAAGLDSRAWRLAWPAGCVVYEIDQPKVLEFKTGTLESHAVDPIASHVSVGIDLRLDWPKALTEAGFDASVPTAWSAEGLLPYLTADAQYLLFERIQSLSAPRSRVAVEAFTNEFFSAESFAWREEQTEVYRAAAIKLGGKDITESGNLLYEGERTEVVDWLRAHDWTVTAATNAEALMSASNRAVPPGLDAAVPESVFVEGRLH